MIKTEINEFIESIKLELLNYEELESSDIDLFETGFRKLIKENKISKKNFKDGVHFEVFDEMEIFTIADDFANSLLNNDLVTYWKTFE